MLNNIFTTSPAVWAALVAGLVLLPPLIHLINVMRHKRVKWAAMEFLLKSHKKNRNWVWLKQFLLLLSRIACLLLALLLLGNVGCENDRIAKILGSKATHHYVLLDDSFSMSDSADAESAFDRAIATLRLISARTRDREGQRFTLLRYSSAKFPTEWNGSGNDNSDGAGNGTFLVDIDGETVDSRFSERLENVAAGLSVSSFSVGPGDAIKRVEKWVEARDDENAILYFLSDFRTKDWGNANEIQQSLRTVADAGALVELISCADTVESNLAITELRANGNVRVAGTPLMLSLSVKNCGAETVRNVQVKMSSQEFQRATLDSSPIDLENQKENLPTVFIEQIEPGKTGTVRFPVFFNSVGQHVIMAQLPDDAVAIDNVAWNVTNFAAAANVLVIDDDRFLKSSAIALAMNPGQMTGIEPQIRTKDFLRDASVEQLQEFDAVFLMDVDILDQTAVANLESFVSLGGGVCFFLGPETDPAFYNQSLFKQGAGLLPMPLERTFEVPEQVEEEGQVPDLVGNNHPVIEPLAGNKFWDFVQIYKTYQPPRDWVLDQKQSKEQGSIVATIRGDQSLPLMVTGRFGQGRTMVVTTTAGKPWNNWISNPTFIPTVLLVENFLAAGRFSADENLVGCELSQSLAVDSYTPNMTQVVPTTDKVGRTAVDKSLTRGENQNWVGQLSMAGDSLFNTARPGIYEMWLRRVDSTREVRRYAVNVDARESEMAVAGRSQVLAQMDQVKPTFTFWNRFSPEPVQKLASSMTKFLLVLLFAFFVLEMVVAYWASSHPSSKKRNSASRKRLGSDHSDNTNRTNRNRGSQSGARPVA